MTGLLPGWFLLAALSVLGLLIGSFLNVVIYRVPAGLSLVSPGSACPACHQPVRAYDNVPVLSWLVLRARCRSCSAPIPWRYPLVELVTGLLFLAAGAAYGTTPYLAVVLVLTATGIALFMIDLEHRRLPFAITGVAAAGVVVVLATLSVLGQAERLPGALGSAAVWLAVYGGIWLATAGRGMGLGDVALAPVLGLALGWLGWGAGLVGLLAGFAVGAAVGLVLMGVGRAGRRSAVPHGPFMLLGAAVGLFAGDAVWHGYLRLVGLA